MSRPPAPRFGPAVPDASRQAPAQPPDAGPTQRPGLPRLAAGVGLSVLVLLLGMVAKARPVAGFDLAVDRHIAAYDRTALLTALAKAATTAATPEIVGPGLLILIPLILVLIRRRLDALKAFCIIAGALALAEVGKKLINEHRPPTALWAMKADSGSSYPSGHATTAAVLAAVLFVITVRYAGRRAALVLAVLYALIVAASRVYLADHYPLDVIGAMLCALAAACIVTGLAALPVLQPYLQRLDRVPGRHH